MDIRSLGYLRLETAKFDEWRRYALDILGLIEAENSTHDALYLRLDERPFRIAVLRGEQDRLLAVGWEVRDARALATVAAELAAAGIATKDADQSELAERRVEGLLHLDDPNGNHLEVYYGQALDHSPVVTPYGQRFVTGDLGLGHVVLPSPDIDAALDFYSEVLGFRLRDSMRLPDRLVPGGREGRELHWMRFLGCNPRHHSLGLFPGQLPTGIVHFMLELDRLDDVGRGLDRMNEAGVRIASTLGRHTNDLMVSFYADCPSGFQVEYGTEGRLVDDATWTAKEITADSFWGHKWGA